MGRKQPLETLGEEEEEERLDAVFQGFLVQSEAIFLNLVGSPALSAAFALPTPLHGAPVVVGA